MSDPILIEKQILEIEARIKKQSRYTIFVAILAALLGSGGVAGILAITYQKPVETAETHLKEAEASSKQLENELTRHKESIASLQRVVSELEKYGDKDKALAVHKFMLQQEIDFQEFFAGMSTAMKALWKTNPDAARECQKVLNNAGSSSKTRYATLAALFEQ